MADAEVKVIVASNVSLANGTLTGGNTGIPTPLYSMPYTKAEKRTKGILLVNKRDTTLTVAVSGVVGGNALVVEVATEGPDAAEPGFAPPVAKELTTDGELTIGPFGVAVVTDLVEASSV